MAETINLEAQHTNYFINENTNINNFNLLIQSDKDDKINKFDDNNTTTASPIHHLGNYIEEPFTIIQSYFNATGNSKTFFKNVL